MKKNIILLLLAVLISVETFAVEVSAGLGGTFSVNFNEFNLNSDGEKLIPKHQHNMYNQNAFGGGFFLFTDISYVLLSLGMNFFAVTPEDKEIKEMLDKLNINYNLTFFTIEVCGKYPFSIGRFTLFPLTGLEAKIMMSAYNEKRENYEDFELSSDKSNSILDLSGLWLKIGAGADFSLSKNFYLRFIFLYGFGLPNNSQKYFNASINKEKELGSIINHGPDFKLAFAFIPKGK